MAKYYVVSNKISVG